MCSTDLWELSTAWLWQGVPLSRCWAQMPGSRGWGEPIPGEDKVSFPDLFLAGVRLQSPFWRLMGRAEGLTNQQL